MVQYSPDIGRFLQPDPIGFNGDPTNLYRYCGNNPLKRIDPTGLGFQVLKIGAEAYSPLGMGGSGISDFFGGFVTDVYSTDGLQIPGTGNVSNPQWTASGVVSTATIHDGLTNADGTPILRALPVDPSDPSGASSFSPLGVVGDILGKIWALPNTVLGLTAEIVFAPFAIAHGGGFQLGNNSIQLVGLPFGNGALTLGNTQLYFNSGPGTNNAYGQDGAYYGPHEQGHTYQNQIFGPFFLPAYFLSGHPFTLDNPFEAGAQAYAFAHPPGG